jgi:hypothetical protein
MSCLFEDLADDEHLTETVDINCSGRTFIRPFCCCAILNDLITIKYLVERVVLQCHVLVPNVAIRALSNVILHIAVVADRRIMMQM